MSLQSNDRRYRLGFIGGGKLAGSVMRGLVRAKFCPAAEILVSEPNEAARSGVTRGAREFAVTAENAEVAEKAEVILIGVKPGVVLQVVDGIAGAIEGKLVISLAAGVRVASMEEKAKGALHARDDEYAGGGLPGGDGAGARGAHDGGGSRAGRARFFPRSDSSSK